MSFLETILVQLEQARDTPILQEIQDTQLTTVTGRELQGHVETARAFLKRQGIKRGECCALLAHNSIRWVAMDLAIMAEGLIVVALYARQAPAELVSMMKDCSPALICCGDAALRDGIVRSWPDAPPQILFNDIFASSTAGISTKPQLSDSDPVTIIYTSGTSGEAKGVVLNAANIGHMLGCTSDRLDVLMNNRQGQDRVFHYLPFCFAGSWIMLLTCLLRGS